VLKSIAREASKSMPKDKRKGKTQDKDEEGAPGYQHPDIVMCIIRGPDAYKPKRSKRPRSGR
jgi:hypothetical protein